MWIRYRDELINTDNIASIRTINMSGSYTLVFFATDSDQDVYGPEGSIEELRKIINKIQTNLIAGAKWMKIG